jgi:hypothetical protein
MKSGSFGVFDTGPMGHLHGPQGTSAAPRRKGG